MGSRTRVRERPGRRRHDPARAGDPGPRLGPTPADRPYRHHERHPHRRGRRAARPAGSASTSRASCGPPRATGCRSPTARTAGIRLRMPPRRRVSARRATGWTAAPPGSPSPPRARRALPRRADPAPAAARRRREGLRAAGTVAGRGRHRQGQPALRLARRDARRLPALLRRRPGQALHRPDGALQDQQAAPAPLRRPGLAHRDRLLAAARHVRRLHRRSAADPAATTRRPTTGRSSGTRPRATWRSSPRSTCPATPTRPSPPTPS